MQRGGKQSDGRPHAQADNLAVLDLSSNGAPPVDLPPDPRLDLNILGLIKNEFPSTRVLDRCLAEKG